MPTSSGQDDLQAESPRTVSPGDRPGSLRELLRVALPLMFSAGSLSLMHTIDRIFLTWYSTDALAAATPAGLLHWTAMSLVIGTASCVTTFVAQFEGAKQTERVAVIVWQGVWLSFSAGLIFLAVVPLSPTIFAWAGHAPQVQLLEIEYFGTLCFGAIPMTLCTVLGGFYSGRARTITVMWVNVCLALANVLLDWLLIFGKGPIPPLGMRGAALATVIAYSGTTLLYFLLMARPHIRREYRFWSAWRFDPALFRRLLHIGLPTGGQFFTDIAAFTLFLLIVGRLGPELQKATNLAFNLNGLAFVPLMGMGTAVMSLVGRRVGEGRAELATRTVWWAFGLGGAWMLAFGLAYFIAPGWMLAPYAAGVDPEEFAGIAEVATVLLRYIAIFAFFDSMVVIFSCAVRGAGDTRFPFVCTLLTSWLLMLGPVVIADALGRNTLTFSWVMCTIAIMTSGTILLVRFLQGRWKSMRLLDATDSAPPSVPSPTDDQSDRSRPRSSGGQPLDAPPITTTSP